MEQTHSHDDDEEDEDLEHNHHQRHPAQDVQQRQRRASAHLIVNHEAVYHPEDDHDYLRLHEPHQHLHQERQPVLPSFFPSSSLTWPLHLEPPSHPTSDPYPSPLVLPELYQDNNPDPPQELKSPPLPPLFQNGCPETWRWSLLDKSHEVRLCGPSSTTAFFHPNWSNGTAGVRGTRPLNGGVHYWEIRVSSRLFGTSMMFGVATRQARLHADSFLNLLGEDEHSWGLSHKGMAWHGGKNWVFCEPFIENVAVTIGMVFDGIQGTLAFYKDGESLGVAFTGLNSVAEDLFPAVCSTAAKTEMTLGVTRRAFLSLQDRCRSSIVKQLVRVRRVGDVVRLPLPRVLCHYVTEEAQAVFPL